MLMNHQPAVLSSDSYSRGINVLSSSFYEGVLVELSFGETSLPTSEVIVLIDDNCAVIDVKIRNGDGWFIPDLEGGHVVVSEAVFLEVGDGPVSFAEWACFPA